VGVSDTAGTYGVCRRLAVASLHGRQGGRASWEKAKLTRVTPHDCRHTYASFAIAAGVNAKALSIYMGHSSIQIT
jgi:integrase